MIAAGGPFVACYAFIGDPTEGKKQMNGFNLGKSIINTFKPIKYHSEVQKIAQGSDGITVIF
jgi:hypothetical protein